MQITFYIILILHYYFLNRFGTNFYSRANLCTPIILKELAKLPITNINRNNLRTSSLATARLYPLNDKYAFVYYILNTKDVKNNPNANLGKLNAVMKVQDNKIGRCI